MASNSSSAPSETLISDLLKSLDDLFGLHSGFRPVHAKGVMCAGEFAPSQSARSLTRAEHIMRDSTPVIVRFSDFAGVPTIADNDPAGAGPRGFAVRFYLGEHEHTDIVGHSEDGFPVRTGEEFLELARALVAGGPTQENFFKSHPKAKAFLEAPKPIPTSFAKEHFFGVNAIKFTNKEGKSRYGRYKIKPDGGTEYLTADQAAGKSANFLGDEMAERLKKGPVKIHIKVQLAEEGDPIDDATSLWPESREEVDFGTLTLNALVNEQEPEKRKIIFDPVPRLDGIEPSTDPLIEVRSQIYLMSGRRRRQHYK